MTHSPILSAQYGAVPTPLDHPSQGIAWHYGDPLGEQRAAESGTAIVDRSDRSVVTIAGEERLSWLHTISSQHLTDLADRHSAENTVLDVNGRVEQHFTVTDIEGVAWLDTEGDHGATLLDYLTKMVFWAKAEPAARADMAVLTLVGPTLRTGAAAELLDIPADAPVYAAGDLPELHHDDEPLGFWRVMPPIGTNGSVPVVDLVMPDTEVVARWRSLVEAGVVPAGIWAYDALRVAALRARVGVDTDDRTIPHEVNWIGSAAEFGAVHLDKGCYRGQETVARVHNLGRPPRRLVLLHLDGSADRLPVSGDQVLAGGRAVGRIGTVIDHYEYGPMALALVKRNVPATAELTAGDPQRDERLTAARIDPDLYTEDDTVPAGRAAIDRLRGRG